MHVGGERDGAHTNMHAHAAARTYTFFGFDAFWFFEFDTF